MERLQITETQLHDVISVLKNAQEAAKDLSTPGRSTDEYVERVRELRAAVGRIPQDIIDREVVTKDALFPMITGEVKFVDCLLFNTDTADNPIPAWAEQDTSIIQIHQSPWWKDENSDMDLVTWAKYLVVIFSMMDCTDCCDAIETVKIGPYATMIEINSSRTFHS